MKMATTQELHDGFAAFCERAGGKMLQLEAPKGLRCSIKDASITLFDGEVYLVSGKKGEGFALKAKNLERVW